MKETVRLPRCWERRSVVTLVLVCILATTPASGTTVRLRGARSALGGAGVGGTSAHASLQFSDTRTCRSTACFLEQYSLRADPSDDILDRTALAWAARQGKTGIGGVDFSNVDVASSENVTGEGATVGVGGSAFQPPDGVLVFYSIPDAPCDSFAGREQANCELAVQRALFLVESGTRRRIRSPRILQLLGLAERERMEIPLSVPFDDGDMVDLPDGVPFIRESHVQSPDGHIWMRIGGIAHRFPTIEIALSHGVDPEQLAVVEDGVTYQEGEALWLPKNAVFVEATEFPTPGSAEFYTIQARIREAARAAAAGMYTNLRSMAPTLYAVVDDDKTCGLMRDVAVFHQQYAEARVVLVRPGTLQQCRGGGAAGTLELRAQSLVRSGDQYFLLEEHREMEGNRCRRTFADVGVVLARGMNPSSALEIPLNIYDCRGEILEYPPNTVLRYPGCSDCRYLVLHDGRSIAWISDARLAESRSLPYASKDDTFEISAQELSARFTHSGCAVPRPGSVVAAASEAHGALYVAAENEILRRSRCTAALQSYGLATTAEYVLPANCSVREGPVLEIADGTLGRLDDEIFVFAAGRKRPLMHPQLLALYGWLERPVFEVDTPHENGDAVPPPDGTVVAFGDSASLFVIAGDGSVVRPVRHLDVLRARGFDLSSTLRLDAVHQSAFSEGEIVDLPEGAIVRYTHQDTVYRFEDGALTPFRSPNTTLAHGIAPAAIVEISHELSHAVRSDKVIDVPVGTLVSYGASPSVYVVTAQGAAMLADDTVQWIRYPKHPVIVLPASHSFPFAGVVDFPDGTLVRFGSASNDTMLVREGQLLRLFDGTNTLRQWGVHVLDDERSAQAQYEHRIEKDGARAVLVVAARASLPAGGCLGPPPGWLTFARGKIAEAGVPIDPDAISPLAYAVSVARADPTLRHELRVSVVERCDGATGADEPVPVERIPLPSQLCRRELRAPDVILAFNWTGKVQGAIPEDTMGPCVYPKSSAAPLDMPAGTVFRRRSAPNRYSRLDVGSDNTLVEREFVSLEAMLSHGTDPKRVITIDDDSGLQYSHDSALTLKDGTLFVYGGDRSTVYLVEGGKKRRFATVDVLQRRGMATARVYSVSPEAHPFPDGERIDYPDGTIICYNAQENPPTVYLLENDRKRRLESLDVIFALRQSYADVKLIDQSRTFPDGPLLALTDLAPILVRYPSSPRVFRIEDNQKRLVSHAELAEQGAQAHIVNISRAFVDLHMLPDGPPTEGSGPGLPTAFHVWLSLPDERFWANLHPKEPNRIVDVQFSQTREGQVLLESDLLMKQSVGQLSHPDSRDGLAFWRRLYRSFDENHISDNICFSFRQWVVPDNVTIGRGTDGNVYVVNASMRVEMETKYLEDRNRGNEVFDACPNTTDPRVPRLAETVFRDDVIPRLIRRINLYPEYLDLRESFYWRALAQWYRRNYDGQQLLARMIRPLEEIASPAPWRGAMAVWKDYVKSALQGEYKMERDVLEDDGKVYVYSFFYGAIHFEHLTINEVDLQQ